MRKKVSIASIVLIFICITIVFIVVCTNRIENAAIKTNQEKVTLIEECIESTVSLLESLVEDEYFISDENTWHEKEIYLQSKKYKEEMGYMMIHVLDENVNIYREDIGLASNLGSREYMKKLYLTGETQVSDVFLAGADGKTMNYTVVAAIKKDSQVTGAIMAAIYGTEIDELLESEDYHNILIGSRFHYMGGVSDEEFGLEIPQILKKYIFTTESSEKVLEDFSSKKEGHFYGYGISSKYYIYTPVENTNWFIMTEVNFIHVIYKELIVYLCCVVALIGLTVVVYKFPHIFLLRENKNKINKI